MPEQELSQDPARIHANAELATEQAPADHCTPSLRLRGARRTTTLRDDDHLDSTASPNHENGLTPDEQMWVRCLGVQMKGIRIRPEKEGLRAALFDLEADVMDVVWSNGWEQFGVPDVHQALARSRSIAYTTVMTTVARLHDKGLLKRFKDGRRYTYSPCFNRVEFSEAMARELLGSLTEVGHQQALALLVDQVADSDAEELDRLEALIKKRKRELGR